MKLHLVKWIRSCAILMALLLSNACDPKNPKSQYDNCIANSQIKLQELRDFNRLVPDSSHAIAYFTGEFGKPRWRARGLIGERHFVELSFDIVLASSREEVETISNVSFIVYEVNSFEIDPTGMVTSSGYTTIVEGGRDDWDKFVRTNGDLSQFGHPLNNQPLPGLAKAWRKVFGG